MSSRMDQGVAILAYPSRPACGLFLPMALPILAVPCSYDPFKTLASRIGVAAPAAYFNAFIEGGPVSPFAHSVETCARDASNKDLAFSVDLRSKRLSLWIGVIRERLSVLSEPADNRALAWC
jgi:hypothetical protein